MRPRRDNVIHKLHYLVSKHVEHPEGNMLRLTQSKRYDGRRIERVGIILAEFIADRDFRLQQWSKSLIIGTRRAAGAGDNRVMHVVRACRKIPVVVCGKYTNPNKTCHGDVLRRDGG